MSDNLMMQVRAFLSVSDKRQLVEVARELSLLGIELISTGGTSRDIAAAGIKVMRVEKLTGFPEIMDGRVKTLHPLVHGGLLAIRGNHLHELAMAEHGIKPIDLLIVNLYPFEETVAKGASFDDCIENIDVGGPAMIRAAAKNHKYVTVITDTGDYDALLEELKTYNCSTTEAFRKKMAAKAFERTAAYDSAIATWFKTKI